MVVSLGFLDAIMPVIVFMFVFILLYTLLIKSGILGDGGKFPALFLSLIVAAFFVVNVQLVDFLKMNVSWIVFIVLLLFIMLLIAGFMGKDALELVTKGGWHKGILGALLVLVVIVFIVSSTSIFNWAITWDIVSGWVNETWFGMILLLIVAAAVSWKLTKK